MRGSIEFNPGSVLPLIIGERIIITPRHTISRVLRTGWFINAIITILTVLLILISCSSGDESISCQDNIVDLNSGFEDKPMKGWISLGNSGISRDAHSGWKALIISDGDGGVQRFFHCTPGDNFTLTLYLKKEGNPSWAGFGIDFENLMGETLAENAFAPDITGEYQQYSITRQAPDSTIRVEIWIYQQGESGSLFADDICFTLQEIQ